MSDIDRDFSEAVADTALERTMLLAKAKSDLRDIVDTLQESDSVVLLVGARRKGKINGEEATVCTVRVSRQNCFHFEAVGILNQALFQVQHESSE
jgi:hypothetical protein